LMSAATPTPVLPHQGAGLTARRGREKRTVASSRRSVNPIALEGKRGKTAALCL